MGQTLKLGKSPSTQVVRVLLYLHLGIGEKPPEKNNKGESVIVGALSLQSKVYCQKERNLERMKGHFLLSVFLNLNCSVKPIVMCFEEILCFEELSGFFKWVFWSYSMFLKFK